MNYILSLETEEDIVPIHQYGFFRFGEVQADKIEGIFSWRPLRVPGVLWRLDIFYRKVRNGLRKGIMFEKNEA